MMPIALGLGAADPSFRSPMSIAVIGGLITSTVLSLLVVPAVFTYVDDIAGWLRRMAHKLQRRGKLQDTTTNASLTDASFPTAHPIAHTTPPPAEA